MLGIDYLFDVDGIFLFVLFPVFGSSVWDSPFP